jgi:hypothetical protein
LIKLPTVGEVIARLPDVVESAPQGRVNVDDRPSFRTQRQDPDQFTRVVPVDMFTGAALVGLGGLERVTPSADPESLIQASAHVGAKYFGTTTSSAS